jgi:chemotaxis protein methyltransferase CheR
LSYSDTVDAVDAATYLGDLCRDLVASVQNVGTPSIVLKTDIARELLPIGQAIPMVVRERARHECPRACFPGRDKGHHRGNAKAGLWGASLDGHR